jgi:hypothetical protein
LKDLAVLLYDKQLMEVFLRKIPTRPQDEWAEKPGADDVRR